LGSYREACYDSFIRRNRTIHRNLINLCGKLTQIPLNANGTPTEEDFEIITFIENSAPFTMLLGKPWIERDQARRKEEEVLEQRKKELKEFMTRRITDLIEEQRETI
jgi:hypothetical protein